MDEGTAAIFHRAVGYKPPPSLSSVVTKHHPGEAMMAQYGNRIHAFLPQGVRIEFGGITPKGNHLTINIAGKKVNTDIMNSFLDSPEVHKALFLPGESGMVHLAGLKYVKGRFPCGLAQHYTGDRFVILGDSAGLVRAFKGKGVTSAIQTGIRASNVILTHGISNWAFGEYHAANLDITRDLPFGKTMRHLTLWASRLGVMGIIIRAAKNDPGLRRALFDAVSAHRSYSQVARDSISFNAMRAMLTSLIAPSKTIKLSDRV